VPQRRSVGLVSRGSVLSGRFGGSFREELFVVDRRQHLAAAVPAPVVVGVDEPGDLPSGLFFGLEVSAGEQRQLLQPVTPDGGFPSRSRGAIASLLP
jgi:hypothetical protein